MYNSQLSSLRSQQLADNLPEGTDEVFVGVLFGQLLGRLPSAAELSQCVSFLDEHRDRARARQQLALILVRHDDFAIAGEPKGKPADVEAAGEG